MSPSQINHATDFEPNETITANTWQVQKKQPWPTLTRRMQFYIDHEYFLELGEALPVHKDNPKLGGDYPLQMTGGHDALVDPRLVAGQQDAAHPPAGRAGRLHRRARGRCRARGIRRRGGPVRVYNDVGSFEIQAKVTPTVRPGQVVVYHAWEPYQFKRGKSHQSLIPSPMNPIHLAGRLLPAPAHALDGRARLPRPRHARRGRAAGPRTLRAARPRRQYHHYEEIRTGRTWTTWT